MPTDKFTTMFYLHSTNRTIQLSRYQAHIQEHLHVFLENQQYQIRILKERDYKLLDSLCIKELI